MAEEETGPDTGNQGGEEGNEFLGSLPEDLQSEPSLADFKDVAGLAKSYVHAQKLVGRDKMPVPTDDSDELAWNDVYSKLGRPDDPTGYEFSAIDPEKDGFDVQPEFLDSFKQTAHTLGMNAKQADGALGFMKDFVMQTKADAEAAYEKQYEQSTTELRKEFGSTYEAKIGLADRALNHFFGPEMVEKMENYGLLNDTGFVKGFVKLGEQIGEDKFGAAEAGMGRMTPGEARNEIEKLKLDGNFMQAYTDRYHTGHGGAVERMQELFRDAYPG